MNERHATIGLGQNKGTPRVYLKGRWLDQMGFSTGEPIDIEYRTGCVTIHLGGPRRVSHRADIPVIDIQNEHLAAVFESAEKLQVTARDGVITITPAYTELLVAGRELTNREGSLFSGGGLLTEAAHQSGFVPTFAVEIDPDLADIYQANHSGTLYNMSVEQVPWHKLREHRIGLLTMGIPCEPFSRSRTTTAGSKRDRSLPPEAHELGDMTFFALRAIEAANPHTVIIEEAESYLHSASACVVQSVMRRWGYTVDGRVINSLDFGELTERKRTVIAATMGPVRWPDPIHRTRTLGDILDPTPTGWFDHNTKPWLFEHWKRQIALGNGFASSVYHAGSPYIGTIKKRYLSQQGDNPVIAHPTQVGVYRWLSLSELRRLHGIPATYDLGDTKIRAGEIIGQGVVVPLFRRIIESVTGRTAASPVQSDLFEDMDRGQMSLWNNECEGMCGV